MKRFSFCYLKMKIKENPLLSFLILLLILLAIFFVAVMFFVNGSSSFNLFGKQGDEKSEALTFLGLGMGGILVAMQALISYKRAKAMEETAEAQADAAKAQAKATKEQAKANLHTEQGQRQERLKNAIEHLGDKNDSVRLGGAYELFHLAEDTEKLRQTILDIFCAHIRRTTSKDEYREVYKLKPSEEVQSLLTLLFVQEHEVFKGRDINLQGSWLNGADLREARLAKVILTKAHLQGAALRKAHLSGADLMEAYLQGADLRGVHLHGSILRGAYLQGSNLSRAYLQGSNLFLARLQGVSLSRAYLQGVSLSRAHLQGSNLHGAYLQGSNLSRAYLQGSILRGAYLQGAGNVTWSPYMSFRNRIQRRLRKKADLSSVVFAGGLTKEDVDSLVEGLSMRKANELRKKLEPHIDKPISNELPENSSAITGTYTKEEAEKWIAEYEKAMSEVPEDDS